MNSNQRFVMFVIYLAIMGIAACEIAGMIKDSIG